MPKGKKKKATEQQKKRDEEHKKESILSLQNLVYFGGYAVDPSRMRVGGFGEPYRARMNER